MKSVHYLAGLEKIKTSFNQDLYDRKLKLLNRLQRRRMNSASQVRRLHDLVSFIYAYPDNPEIFDKAALMLRTFDRRSDLKKFRSRLVNSGIAGTDVHYQFFWPMACWLAEGWPASLSIAWDDIEDEDKLQRVLPLLLSVSESGLVDEFDLTAREWLESLKKSDETGAVFFVKRLNRTYATDFERESFHDDLNLTYQFAHGAGTPHIGNSLYSKSPVTCQEMPFPKSRPVLSEVIKSTRFRLKKLSLNEGGVMVNLARGTMLTHERDLDAFSYGNPGDVRLADFGNGYQIACVGMLPERRYLLHSTYGLLNLKNGIPIGYSQICTIFNFAELAFNLFEPFRGGEASYIFARNLAVAHQLFQVNSFNLDPYQLGHGNMEGLMSGVWWFYYKLGFKPMDKGIQRRLNAELKKMAGRPGYRSDLKTLDILASDNLFYNIDGRDTDYHKLENIGYVAAGISKYLARRFGALREEGLEKCAREAIAMLRSGPMENLARDERHAWLRWSPLVLNLGNIRAWPGEERRQLRMLITAKGRRDELDYLHGINGHTRLKRRILAFAGRSDL